MSNKKVKFELNKIYQKDCIEGMKQLPDNSIDLIITDPPYNISQGYNIQRKNMNLKSIKRNSDIILDFGEWDKFESEKNYFDFTERWFRECIRVLKPKGWIYIWFDKQRTGYFDLFLAKKYGVCSKTIYVWHKTNPVPQFRKVNYLSCTEFCWVGTKGKAKVKNFGYIKDMHTVVNYINSSIYGVTEHPTEKPLFIIEKFIKHNSNKGDIVLDPFMGSGTTAVACLKMDRKFIGFEISPKYHVMCEKRIKPWLEQDKLSKYHERKDGNGKL